MQEAFIVSGVRTAVARAHKGGFRTTRPDDLAAAVIREAVARAPGLDPAVLDDVIVGCAMPEGEQGLNFGRLAVLLAGFPNTVPGQTVNRFCSSGVQTIALAAQQIMAGMGDAIVAGGSESMTAVSMQGHAYSPNYAAMQVHPELYMGMGITAENVAKKYGVTREDQDAFATRSHQRAAAAQAAGRFDAEILPIETEITDLDATGKPKTVRAVVKRDEFVRAETTPEILGKLKPVFAANGTVTAGNASPLSDGAAAVTVLSGERVKALGLQPQMRFVSFAVAGVPPEIMGIGPVAAIPKALKRAGLTLADIDLFELNEAFAAQALAVIRELGLDPEKVNVNGGAIALGHPLGATGAKLTVQLMNELARRKGRYGMVTMCIGGGMGAAAVFENLRR
ncbi:MAG: acetyl-CoA C-acyltransferase [Thermoflexales bacterium]|nr:acetyl-CoA C-acyltransferase [Thermoflexales bacterium]